MLLVVSVLNVTVLAVLNFFSEFKSFCLVFGTIYPSSLISKVLLTTLSLSAVISVLNPNWLIDALNLNLSGSPQYASDAYCHASPTESCCSTS